MSGWQRASGLALRTGMSGPPVSTWEASQLRVLGDGGDGEVLERGEVGTWEQRPKQHKGPGEKAMWKLHTTQEPKPFGGATKGSWSWLC